MKMKQKIGLVLISTILLSAVAFAAPANNTTMTTAKPMMVTKLTAAFTSTHNPKTPMTVKFTDKSTGSPTKWSWDFGDKTMSKVKNPVHMYMKEGKYTVTLKVTNAKGQSSTMKKTLNLTMKMK
jgi:PKD repeat protein